MKKESRLKKRLAALLALIAGKAFAFIWIVIAILVLVVGLFVIIKLVQLIKRVLPDDPRKGAVLRIFQDSEDEQSIVRTIYDNSGDVGNIQPEDDGSPATASFSINYMLDSNKVAQVVIGPSTDAVNISEVSGTDEDNYSCRITGEGQDVRFVVQDGVVTSFEFLSPTNESDMTNMYQPVIERSTNMLDWTAIGTNDSVNTYTVQDFTDTDAPPANAFYRVVVPVQ